MRNLFENRFIKRNNIVVGVSLKLTLEEATIINSLCGAISSDNGTPRTITDAVWVKLGRLNIPFLSDEELFVDGNPIEFINNSLDTLNEKCQDFRIRLHRTPEATT